MEYSPDLKGIQEVADLLSITPRTLRFYEEKGLIRPIRIGAIRVYDRRELARIRLVLRARRLGISLTDTAEFLYLYDADPKHPDQLTALAERMRRRIVELREQRRAIDQTLKELTALEDVALKRLASHEAAENVARTPIAAAAEGADSNRPLPPRSSAAHECEQVGVDDVRVRRRHAV
jgi:DNA-binding transcriptional MerR regulator